MSDLFYDTPWWLVASLIFVGAVLFWTGNTRQQNAPRALGVVLILLAILLKIVSYFVETDKEVVARESNELVTAVQNRDWTKMSSLLDRDVRLGTATGTLFANRDALIKGAKADTDNYGLTNLSARVTDVEQDQSGITVNVDAWSEQSASMGRRVPSSWKMVWDQSGKQWFLHEVTCLSIGNEKTDQIDRLLGK